MIPKTIHYCWFGRGEKPELALKCIESWKKFCPEYEIVEWNEDNFDINSNLYVKQAYEARKFAFVTDYVRLWAIYNHGGIYMDTDVEVLKSFDQYLHHEAFSGFESTTNIPTGIMAAQKGQKLIEKLLHYYDDAKFLNDDGTYNMTTNVEIITGMIGEEFVPNGQFQIVEGFALYPQNVFCPDTSRMDDADYIKDTVTIHWFAGSWKSDARKKREGTIWYRVGVGIYIIMLKVFGRSVDKIKHFISTKVFKD